MSKALAYFANQLSSVRGNFGAINNICSLIGTVKITHNNQSTPLNHLASVWSEGNTKGLFTSWRISVSPFEPGPEILGAIDRALKAAGYDCYIFSKTTVVVSIAPVTSETKAAIADQLRKLSEDAKVAIRNVRKKARQGLTKDEVKRLDKELQALTDQHIAQVEQLTESKIGSL